MQIAEAEEELRKAESHVATPSSTTTVNREVLWTKTRTDKDGNMDEAVRKVVDKMV